MKISKLESESTRNEMTSEKLPAKKTPPSAVLGLKNEQKYVSESEIQQQEIQRRQEASRQRSLQSAFDEANKPPLISLPNEILLRLQTLLNIPNDSAFKIADKTEPPRLEAVTRKLEVRNPLACYGITDRLYDLMQKLIRTDDTSVLEFQGMLILYRALVHAPSSIVYSDQDVEDEILSLSAIYCDSFHHESFSATTKLTIDVSNETSMSIELIIRSIESKQPIALPLIRARKSVYYEPDVIEVLRRQLQLWTFSTTLSQVPCMFESLMFVQDRPSSDDIDVEKLFIDALGGEDASSISLASEELPSQPSGDSLNIVDEKITKNSQRNKSSFWRRSSVHTLQTPTSILGNQSLPAFQAKQQFLDLLRTHPAMVVTGETGSGKTTQIPQFILEEFPTSKIVICQPRRLAATSVAVRVADEMNTKIGEKVGYMVRGDSKVGLFILLCFLTGSSV